MSDLKPSERVMLSNDIRTNLIRKIKSRRRHVQTVYHYKSFWDVCNNFLLAILRKIVDCPLCVYARNAPV